MLRWSIAHGADVKNDTAIQRLINDQLYYIVTFEDVNFFEMFRLTQMYREKLRIINEEKAIVPPRSELATLFPGGYAMDPEKPNEKTPLCELAEHVMTNFINLVLQMNADNDIIGTSSFHLFIPMLCRKFTVQIPVGFADFIGSMKPTEADEIYNHEYPETLNKILENPMHSVQMILQTGFIKGTSIIQYTQQYDRYLKTFKYSPLKNAQSDKLWKFKMVGFHKVDPITRGEVRVDMFNPDKEEMQKTMKWLGRINAPLEVDFAVQIPIHYMQILLNCYDRSVIKVDYESSMADIIDCGMTYKDFKIIEIPEDAEDKDKLQEKNESISAYKVRVSEANKLVLNSIPIIVQSETDVDVTAAFSMLPCGYNTRAIVTLRSDHIQDYTDRYDPTVSDMLSHMVDFLISLNEDLKNMAQK
ncbi:MAG: hypothetical protein NC489_11090 [Ruminococcus flavefaciens]|nr:hypothetical protein [Ruminococcus flavefaciens]